MPPGTLPGFFVEDRAQISQIRFAHLRPLVPRRLRIALAVEQMADHFCYRPPFAMIPVSGERLGIGGLYWLCRNN
jgi:hypothetical protein